MQSVSDLIEREHGNRNWVLARRTPAILARYGADVVTLTRKQLGSLQKRFEIETADQSPAYPLLKKLLGSHCDAVNVIRALRDEGMKIETVYGDSK